MIEIRKALNPFLKSLHPRVYFNQAPQTAVFPYLKYDLQMYPDGEGNELVTLEVDGWDSNTAGDPMPVELLMDSLKALDKKTLSTDLITVTFFLENRLTVEDDNKDIKHRKYSYAGNLIRRDY